MQRPMTPNDVQWRPTLPHHDTYPPGILEQARRLRVVARLLAVGARLQVAEVVVVAANSPHHGHLEGVKNAAWELFNAVVLV